MLQEATSSGLRPPITNHESHESKSQSTLGQGNKNNKLQDAGSAEDSRFQGSLGMDGPLENDLLDMLSALHHDDAAGAATGDADDMLNAMEDSAGSDSGQGAQAGQDGGADPALAPAPAIPLVPPPAPVVPALAARHRRQRGSVTLRQQSEKLEALFCCSSLLRNHSREFPDHHPQSHSHLKQMFVSNQLQFAVRARSQTMELVRTHKAAVGVQRRLDQAVQDAAGRLQAINSRAGRQRDIVELPRPIMELASPDCLGVVNAPAPGGRVKRGHELTLSCQLRIAFPEGPFGSTGGTGADFGVKKHVISYTRSRENTIVFKLVELVGWLVVLRETWTRRGMARAVQDAQTETVSTVLATGQQFEIIIEKLKWDETKQSVSVQNDDFHDTDNDDDDDQPKRKRRRKQRRVRGGLVLSPIVFMLLFCNFAILQQLLPHWKLAEPC